MARKHRERATRPPPVAPAAARPWWRNRVTGAGVAILLLAAFLRFHDLATAPPGLCLDEAMNGVNALEAIRDGDVRLYYPDNSGRERLFINVQALYLLALGGDSHTFNLQPWMLRVPSAIFGTLTVVGLWLLTRLLTGSDFAALAAAFFTATSFWHINFSRIGFRAIAAPFFLVWALAFLILGFARLQERRPGPAYVLLLLAGILYGAGFHTYISYRVTPLPMLVVLIGLAGEWSGAGRVREFVKGAAAFVFVAAAVSAPIVMYMLLHRAEASARTNQLSVFNTGHPVRAILENSWKTALMFNVSGDRFWRHNISGQPELFLPVGLLFLTGIGVTIYQIARREHRWWIGALALTWLAAACIPAILANEGVPHALRSILAIPVCFLLAAIGAQTIRAWLARFGERVVHIAIAAVVLIVGGAAYYSYFVAFAPRSEVRAAFDTDQAELGREMAMLPIGAPKYLIVLGAMPDARGTPIYQYSAALLAGAFNEEERALRKFHFVYDRSEAERVAHEAQATGAYVYAIQ